MFGHGGKTSTNALLRKVNSQLKGEKLTAQNGGEEDLDEYLSTLTKKKTTPAQPQWDRFGELSDSDNDDKFKPHSPGVSTEIGSAGSKFLKKKSAIPAQQHDSKTSTFNKGNMGKAQGNSIGQAKNQAPTIARTSHTTGQSSALNKAALYNNKYSSPAKSSAPTRYGLLSDSDMDMNISADEDIIADVRTLKENSNKFVQQKTPVRTGKSSSHPAVDTDDDSSSIQIGRGGSKFLKKKPTNTSPNLTRGAKGKANNKENQPLQDQPSNVFSVANAEYTSRMFQDDDSYAELITQASGSSSSRTPRDIMPHSPSTPWGRTLRPPSPMHTPRSLSMADIEEEGTFPEHGRVVMAMSGSSDDESIESEESFKLNVMDFDDLQPAVELGSSSKKKSRSLSKKKTKSKSSTRPAESDDDDEVFHLRGLQTVDDLFINIEGLSVASEIHTGGATSDIHTEADDNYESDFDPLSRSGRSPTPLKSILSTTPRNLTPRSSQARVRYSLAEIAEIRSRSPSPEVISTARGSVTASVIHTESDRSIHTEPSTSRSIPEETDNTDTYTDEYTDDFSSQSGLSSPDRTPRPGYQSKPESDAYSDDFTSAIDISRGIQAYSRSSSRDSVPDYSDDYTSFTESSQSRSRTPSPDRRPHKAKTRSREVQTGMDVGLAYNWNSQTSGAAVLGPEYGMAFVDPTPIASHVISADALEALTGFSPSVIALNDMLRQQLALTTQFMDMQNRLHANYSNMLPPGDYQYTTLQDTKQFIKKNKPRCMTFKEALRQVKAEMGLKN